MDNQVQTSASRDSNSSFLGRIISFTKKILLVVVVMGVTFVVGMLVGEFYFFRRTPPKLSREQKEQFQEVTQVIRIGDYVFTPALKIGTIQMDILRKEKIGEYLPGTNLVAEIGDWFLGPNWKEKVQTMGRSEVELLLRAPCKVVVSLPIQKTNWRLEKKNDRLYAYVPKPEFSLEIDFERVEVYNLKEDIWISGERKRRELEKSVGPLLRALVQKQYPDLWRDHKERFRKSVAEALFRLLRTLGVKEVIIFFEGEESVGVYPIFTFL